MKIIITEEMLRNIVLNEAFDPDVARIADMQRQADAKYYAKNPAVYNRGLQQNMSQATNNNLSSFIRSMFSGNRHSNMTLPGTWDGKPIENIGDWDVGKSVNWIMSQPPSKGLCATYVLRAITAGGGPNMTCSENGGDSWADCLHYNGILKSHGFMLVDSGRLPGNGNYTGNLQPGDVMISDAHIRYKRPGKPDGKRVHAAMWCGNQWVSDFKQNNANVYTVPIDFWIYRYAGNRK